MIAARLRFPWFDTLTEQGLWWISRYANEVSYQVRHILYQGDGVLDALVYLGRHRADQAKYAVRLVQFSHQGHWHRYLTNVLDPQQLSLAEIVRLYGRRSYIELAFGVLKEHLAVSALWSAKWSVIQVQIWAALLLAQLFHGMQMQLGVTEGVEPFDVSIDLLIEVVPQLLRQGIAPLPYLGRFGRELGIIRPESPSESRGPFCRCHLDHSCPARGGATPPEGTLRSTQVPAASAGHNQEEGSLTDALFSICWSQ